MPRFAPTAATKTVPIDWRLSMKMETKITVSLTFGDVDSSDIEWLMTIGYRVLFFWISSIQPINVGTGFRTMPKRRASQEHFQERVYKCPLFVSFPVSAAPKPGLPLEVPFGQRIQTNSLATQHESPWRSRWKLRSPECFEPRKFHVEINSENLLSEV